MDGESRLSSFPSENDVKNAVSKGHLGFPQLLNIIHQFMLTRVTPMKSLGENIYIPEKVTKVLRGKP